MIALAKEALVEQVTARPSRKLRSDTQRKRPLVEPQRNGALSAQRNSIVSTERVSFGGDVCISKIKRGRGETYSGFKCYAATESPYDTILHPYRNLPPHWRDMRSARPRDGRLLSLTQPDVFETARRFAQDAFERAEPRP